jgi:hypothetical protein
MTPDERAYYATQSAMSDPGAHARLFDALPADPERLIAAVSGLVLDPRFVGRLGITLPPESAEDAAGRTIPKMLVRILARDGAPLDVARPPERRFIGICRDYALVACAALRHRGIPARLRAGFATYFERGFHDDHWVCEYHTGGEWRLVDPELSAARVRDLFNITFSPTDVPRDAFLVAGEVWRRIRGGAIDPMTCGVHAHGLKGAWFVGGNVVKDLAALNKHEMQGWDYWGLSMQFSGPGMAVPDAAAARLDAISAITAEPEPDWKRLCETYERDAMLRVPPVVKSFGPSGPKEVSVLT